MMVRTFEAALPHVDIVRERREYVAGNEPRYLFFFPLDCVSEVFYCTACCILQIGADTRVTDGNVQ